MAKREFKTIVLTPAEFERVGKAKPTIGRKVILSRYSPSRRRTVHYHGMVVDHDAERVEIDIPRPEGVK